MTDTTEIAGTRAGLKALDEETIADLRAQLAESRATSDEFKRDAIALEQLRVVVAEIEEQDTKTWPSHGNKALAIAALYKLNHDAIDKQRAQLAARDKEVGRLREALRDLMAAFVGGDVTGAVDRASAALKGEG